MVLTLWAVILLMGVCLSSARADLVDRVLVVINDDIILLSEVEKMLASLQVGLEQQGYPPNEMKRIAESQREKVVERLIYDKLTDQQVKRHQLKVKDYEVDATIKRIREANKLSQEELQRTIELDGMTYEAYRKEIKDKMLRTRLVNREVKSKIVITDADIKNYYDLHIDRYTGSTKFKLRHILVKNTPGGSRAGKDDALSQINAIRERLMDGESFEKMAKLFSDAPTAAQGGRLGVFGTQLLTDQIARALKDLKPKQFSEVVETDQGFQIFYVEEVIQTDGKNLSEASAEIREKLYAEVVDQKFNSWIEALRKRSHIQILE